MIQFTTTNYIDSKCKRNRHQPGARRSN